MGDLSKDDAGDVLSEMSFCNVIWISSDKRYAKEEGREAMENGLFLFSVSRLRIPKIPDFC